MVFPVVMYGCESWTKGKAEHQRINAFKLWCWRRLSRDPWTARRSNQPILNEISPWIFIGRTDAEAETPILWPPDAKNWLIWKNPDAGKDWKWEEKGTTEGEMVGWHHQCDGRVWVGSRSWSWTGKPGVLQSMGSQSWTWLSDWTDKPSRQDFKHDLSSTADECNCLMVRTFFSTTLLGNWDEDWPFSVATPGPSRLMT